MSSEIVDYREVNAHRSDPVLELPPVHTSRTLIASVRSGYRIRNVFGHVVTVNDPNTTVSLLEPFEETGCAQKLRAPTPIMSDKFNCHVAINAGYFNIRTNECIGNLVSNSKIIQKTPPETVNAGFGITKSGNLAFGYVPHAELENFSQFVNGVIWIIKDGQVNIQNAVDIETSSSQATGSLYQFADIVSARTAVGHDKDGRLVIVQVDGQSYKRGVNLVELAQLMIKEFGVVNAINLDGGGSSQISFHGALADYPSDICPMDPEYQCVRPISSVLCVREQKSCNADCSLHGRCERGRCLCEKNWTGLDCNIPSCGIFNCTDNGMCIVFKNEPTCKCRPGFMGEDCLSPCKPGTFGVGCENECICSLANSICNSVNGKCLCKLGFSGDSCSDECEPGFYGFSCRQKCPTICQDCCKITGLCGTQIKFNDIKILPRFIVFIRFFGIFSAITFITSLIL